MNIQKQFDTVTGALNIFDMSYLVSGAAMLAVLVYAFPNFRDFLFHEEQVTLSVFVCIVVTYILGMISWVAGKQIRYWCIDSHTESVSKAIVDNLRKLPQSPQISALRNLGAEMAYSYMWMKLDKSNDEDCRSRYLYVSRFWVLRAIYEGLIPSAILFSIFFFLKSQSLFEVSYPVHTLGMNVVVLKMANTFLSTWVSNILLFLLVFTVMVFIVYLLAKEAKRCVMTQIREVVVAYYNFYIDDVPSVNAEERI